jgi:hypothetical protein
MKKITTILVMLMAVTLTFGQVANEYFAPVSWWKGPRNENFAAAAANSSVVVAPMANADMDGNIDITALIAEDVAAIWDRIGDANLIDGFTGKFTDLFDLAADATGTFGAAWKAFYDSGSLFVILKYVDSEAAASARWFEVALQTKEHERYEAGYQATLAVDTAGVGFKYQNQQYGCFRELGGMKIKFDETEAIVENAMSVGSTGTWGGGIGGTAVGDVAIITEASGTKWFILELAFDDLQYYADEWGADEAANYAAMDPTVETIISFEPTARATTTEGEYAAWWNGVNNAYASVYYQGKLEFGTTTFNPVGLVKNTVSETSAYIYNDMLNLKGFDKAVDLEVYSIIGQKVLSAANVSRQLDVSSLNNGVYVVKVKGSKDAFKVLK